MEATRDVAYEATIQDFDRKFREWMAALVAGHVFSDPRNEQEAKRMASEPGYYRFGKALENVITLGGRKDLGQDMYDAFNEAALDIYNNLLSPKLYQGGVKWEQRKQGEMSAERAGLRGTINSYVRNAARHVARAAGVGGRTGEARVQVIGTDGQPIFRATYRQANQYVRDGEAEWTDKSSSHPTITALRADLQPPENMPLFIQQSVYEKGLDKPLEPATRGGSEEESRMNIDDIKRHTLDSLTSEIEREESEQGPHWASRAKKLRWARAMFMRMAGGLGPGEAMRQMAKEVASGEDVDYPTPLPPNFGGSAGGTGGGGGWQQNLMAIIRDHAPNPSQQEESVNLAIQMFWQWMQENYDL